jgi:hypothetical protein
MNCQGAAEKKIGQARFGRCLPFVNEEIDCAQDEIP